MISHCHVDTMIYQFKYHFPCIMYTISWYNRPYKRWLIRDKHSVWLRTRNIFGGSIVITYVYVLLLISYKGLLFSWMFAHTILIICFKYRCMHWHRASRKPLPVPSPQKRNSSIRQEPLRFSRVYNARNYLHFKLKLCTCALSPKHGFGYTYKVLSWKSHENYDICNT